MRHLAVKLRLDPNSPAPLGAPRPSFGRFVVQSLLGAPRPSFGSLVHDSGRLWVAGGGGCEVKAARSWARAWMWAPPQVAPRAAPQAQSAAAESRLAAADAVCTVFLRDACALAAFRGWCDAAQRQRGSRQAAPAPGARGARRVGAEVSREGTRVAAATVLHLDAKRRDGQCLPRLGPHESLMRFRLACARTANTNTCTHIGGESSAAASTSSACRM